LDAFGFLATGWWYLQSTFPGLGQADRPLGQALRHSEGSGVAAPYGHQMSDV